jgi:Big-like domain-containing protein
MSFIQRASTLLPPVDTRSIAVIEQEIVDELEFHLSMRTEDNLRTGASPDEAQRDALTRFGNFHRISKSCRRVLLGERIMLQRTQTILIALLVVAVIGMGASVYQLQRANNTALADLSAAVHQLAMPSTAQAHPANWLADRPRVAETSPAHDAKDIDPSTAEIRVTFDKAMADGCWSWVRSSPEAFPESTGEIHYLDDQKTCVMPVKLEPGKKYVVWFNTKNFQNFKDTDGRPAEPYQLTFTTRK